MPVQVQVRDLEQWTSQDEPDAELEPETGRLAILRAIREAVAPQGSALVAVEPRRARVTD